MLELIRIRIANLLFPKGIAGPFMQENPVRAVNLSRFASNVGPVTRPANAPLTKANPKLHSPVNKPTDLSHKPITPVKVHRLQFFLADYPPHLSSFLINSFRFGFCIQFHDERNPFESPNLKSALENPQIVSLKLQKELEAGRIAGPFPSPPFKNVRSSPLGIVPKTVPSEFLLIQHLSYPKGLSVNDFIPQEFSSVQYATISDAIRVIKHFESGCFMAKTDIKSAFCIIPIHPTDFELLGMKWDNLFYYDRALLMGCSTSCSIFELFSTALEWIATSHLQAYAVLHILDDFFIYCSHARVLCL